MEFIWIRHGMTKGNMEKRYIGGRTDEGLCDAGRRELEEKKAAGLYPYVDIVYVSPMKRCQETAAILYPDVNKQIVEDFRECDFGLFENKNYQELTGLAEYQSWIDGGGMTPFPDGESREGFGRRSIRALQRLVKSGSVPEHAAFVVHGGTIMAVLSGLDEKRADFYEYHTGNGEGYRCQAQLLSGELIFFGCTRLGECL